MAAPNMRWLLWVVGVLYLGVFFLTSYQLYIRLGVFGCGDECINYTAAHFLTLGKSLYTHVFFNRQPLMAYASLLVQYITHPDALYTLVLYHRSVIMVYSLVMGILLIWRFRLGGLLFLLLYEGTKYYVYGYQFIGEAIIVYPLVYMMGTVWHVLISKKLYSADLYAMPFFVSLVFWTREPYVPAAFALLVLFVWGQRKQKKIRTSIFLGILFCVAPYMWIPLPEYASQVIAVNIPAADSALGVKGIMYALFYPLVILVTGKVSYFRFIEIGISLFTAVGVFFWLRQTKKFIPVLVLFGLLGFAAIRSVPPGTMYFEAFHMLPWYALFIMVCVQLLDSISARKAKIIFQLGFIGFAIWAFAAPPSFIWEKVDRQAEFDSQYAKYTHYSTVIKSITTPNQKIFLDMWDDIIYWESNRDSSYPYSLYIPIMAGVSPYKEAREAMFRSNPPSVYYRCPAFVPAYNSLPQELLSDYIQLDTGGKPSCLYVHRTLVSGFTKDQFEVLKRNEYSIP